MQTSRLSIQMINGLYSWGQVKDYWTDAQVHSRDGKGHGLGNCGIKGIRRFAETHTCNEICQHLGLPRMDTGNASSEAVRALPPLPRIQSSNSYPWSLFLPEAGPSWTRSSHFGGRAGRILPRRMSLLTSLRESTPPQNRQPIVYYH